MALIDNAASAYPPERWGQQLVDFFTEAAGSFERSVFYSRPSLRLPAEDVHPNAEEMTIETLDGERLAAIHAPPIDGRPVVVYLHGNGQNLTSRPSLLRDLIDRGFGVIAPSYRGFGGSTGEPREHGLYLDGHAAYAQAEQLYGADRIVAWGYSLGTAVAVQLASERPLNCLVLEAPFTSTADVLGAPLVPFLPVSSMMQEKFCSEGRIGSIGCPLLVMHGRFDGVVPVGQGEKIFELASEPKRLILFDGGHMDLDRHGACDAATAFIEAWRPAPRVETESKMTKAKPAFDWTKSCSYEHDQKEAFHRIARARLKALADALGLPAGSYDLRSNKGGIAVSGEVTLHHDHVYVQAAQSAFGGENGAATGLLIRSCEGRKDYTGGRNHMVHLKELDNPQALALKVLAISPSVRPDVVTDEEDANYGVGLRP